MADAVAHGVTKTTPNATERLGSACIMAALLLPYDWAKLAVARFSAALGAYPATYDQQRTH